MRTWIARFFYRLALWIDPVPDALREDVRALVDWAESFAPGTSGEYKRHAVLAQLRKTHPDAPVRRLGLLIEQVLAE